MQKKFFTVVYAVSEEAEALRLATGPNCVTSFWGEAPCQELKTKKLSEAAELGEVAMRFVDRAGDPHPGIDDAEKICADFHAAMLAVLEPRWAARMAVVLNKPL